MRISSFMRNLLLQYVNDEKQRSKLQSTVIYGAFAVIAFVMSVVNIFTMRVPLLISTASFCILCGINFLLSRKGGARGARIAEWMFIAEIYVLFMFFVITGGTDNFSIVWLLMLPTIGLLFFGKVKGTVVSAAVWASMVLLFHVPQLTSFCTDYGDTFRLRFPIVYLSCYGVAWILESIRATTAKELERTRNMYEELYKMDALTRTMNRYGMRDYFETARKSGIKTMGAAVLDIDHFKSVNDRFGHSAGDDILRGFATYIKENLPPSAALFRWGGEEFVILDTNSEMYIKTIIKLRKMVSEHVFQAGEETLTITFSAGVASMDVSKGNSEKVMDELIHHADQRLYMAKEAGRNRVATGDTET